MQDFPASLVDIENLSIVSLNRFLHELGVHVPVGTDTVEKRQMLKQACGVMRA